MENTCKSYFIFHVFFSFQVYVCDAKMRIFGHECDKMPVYALTELFYSIRLKFSSKKISINKIKNFNPVRVDFNPFGLIIFNLKH